MPRGFSVLLNFANCGMLYFVGGAGVLRRCYAKRKREVKKMTKKILAGLLAVLMLLSLAGCGKGNKELERLDTLYSGFYFDGNSSDKEAVALGNPDTRYPSGSADRLFSGEIYARNVLRLLSSARRRCSGRKGRPGNVLSQG